MAISKEVLESFGFKWWNATSYKGSYCVGLWQKRHENKFFCDFYIYTWPDGNKSVETEGHFTFHNKTVALTVLNPPSVNSVMEIMEKFFETFSCDPLDND